MTGVVQRVRRAQWLRVVGEFDQEPRAVRSQLADYLRGLDDAYYQGLADHLTRTCRREKA